MAAAAVIISAVAAATSTGLAVNSSIEAGDRAAAAKSLEDQRAAQLAQEGRDREALAKHQAETGASFGFEPVETLRTGFGYGPAPRSSANAGRGQITGAG